MTSTTYVARTSTAVPATDRNSRQGTLLYTHAVVNTENADAYTWHTSEALARKAAGGRNSGVVTVVAVEAHEGGKATVLRRLASEVAPAPATPAPEATGPTGARTWDATTTTTHVCAGPCAQELPAASYPTTGKPGQRGVVCRKDRDAARAARTTA